MHPLPLHAPDVVASPASASSPPLNVEAITLGTVYQRENRETVMKVTWVSSRIHMRWELLETLEPMRFLVCLPEDRLRSQSPMIRQSKPTFGARPNQTSIPFTLPRGP